MVKNAETAKNVQDIKSHQMAAEYFELAAKNHRDAARNCEEGNHFQAYDNMLKAIGNARIAKEYQTQDVKQHALENASK